MKKVLSWVLCLGVLLSCITPSTVKADESTIKVDELQDSMYSDDSFYREDNCENDLFSYEKGCFTVKQKFMDNFALCITNADTSKVDDSKFPSSAYINGNTEYVYL